MIGIIVLIAFFLVGLAVIVIAVIAKMRNRVPFTLLIVILIIVYLLFDNVIVVVVIIIVIVLP